MVDFGLPNILNVGELWNNLLRRLGFKQKSGTIVFLGLDYAGKTTLLHVLKDDTVADHIPTFHPHSEHVMVSNVKLTAFDLGGHAAARKLWKSYFNQINGIVFMVDANDRVRLPEARAELNELLSDPEVPNVPIAVFCNKMDLPTAAPEHELREALGLMPNDLSMGSLSQAPTSAFPAPGYNYSDNYGAPQYPPQNLQPMHGGGGYDQTNNMYEAKGMQNGVPLAPATNRPVKIFTVSVIRRQGYEEGFQWLSTYLD